METEQAIKQRITQMASNKQKLAVAEKNIVRQKHYLDFAIKKEQAKLNHNNHIPTPAPEVTDE